MGNKSEFYRQLRLRREQLFKEIHSIDILLADDVETDRPSKSNNTPLFGAIVTRSLGTDLIQKHGLMWNEYVWTVVKTLNKPVKSVEIIDYINQANPGLDGETVKDAVRSNCSKLAKDGYLIAEKVGAKSEGYFYTIGRVMDVAA